MDQEAQIQAIVAKLTGAPPETLPPPDALDHPWRAICQQARPCSPSAPFFHRSHPRQIHRIAQPPVGRPQLAPRRLGYGQAKAIA